MKVRITKYGRWDVNSNWQIENRCEKDVDIDMLICIGYHYNSNYNEYINEYDNHRVVVKVI